MPNIHIDQFVPSQVCLKCDGCCRFKEPGTIWRPKMSDDEQAVVKTSPLSDQIWSVDALDEHQFIRTKPGCGEHLCQFFNPQDHSCAIYSARPFECELYPYVISRENKVTSLYIHLHCPYVQSNHQNVYMKEYTSYLKEFFKRPDVHAFLTRNRHLLNDYSQYRDELEFVFLLEGI